MTTINCLHLRRTTPFVCSPPPASGTINVLLLGIIALLSVTLLLHGSIMSLRQIERTWQQLHDDEPASALLCAVPLHALLQDNFDVDPDALRLPETGQLCLLPATDYGDRWRDSTQLNIMLCALLTHSNITNFQAWGRTCN